MATGPMWRIRTLWSGTAGGDLVSTHYFAAAAAPISEAGQHVANLWTALEPTMANDLTWTVDPIGDTVDPTTGLITGQGTVGTFTGTGDSASEMLALATQGLLQWRTGVFANGQEIRGRTFVPGVVTVALQDGVPTAAYITALQAAADDFVSLGSSDPVVYSRANGRHESITSGAAWNKFAVLRSRRD